jgi:hypothetical protein
MTVQESMEDKKKGLKSYMYQVEAVEAGLRYDIACAFTGVRHGEVPDYSRIPEDRALQERIKEAIDANYSFDNEIHPLHGVVDTDRLDRNFFNDALMRGLLFPHQPMVRAAVSEEDFMDQYGAMEKQSQQQLQSRLMGSAAADVVEQSALPDLKQYLKDSYEGINEPVVDGIENKLQFLQPMTLDMLRLLGGEVTPRQIEDALLGRERQRR